MKKYWILLTLLLGGLMACQEGLKEKSSTEPEFLKVDFKPLNHPDRFREKWPLFYLDFGVKFGMVDVPELPYQGGHLHEVRVMLRETDHGIVLIPRSASMVSSGPNGSIVADCILSYQCYLDDSNSVQSELQFRYLFYDAYYDTVEIRHHEDQSLNGIYERLTSKSNPFRQGDTIKYQIDTLDYASRIIMEHRRTIHYEFLEGEQYIARLGDYSTTIDSSYFSTAKGLTFALNEVGSALDTIDYPYAQIMEEGAEAAAENCCCAPEL